MAPDGVLMAVTVEVAGLEIVTFVSRRENFLVETSVVVGMVDVAANMLVGSDVESHMVVVVAVIAETGAVSADSDAVGAQTTEMENWN